MSYAAERSEGKGKRKRAQAPKSATWLLTVHAGHRWFWKDKAEDVDPAEVTVPHLFWWVCMSADTEETKQEVEDWMRQCKIGRLVWQLENTKEQRLHVQACFEFDKPHDLKGTRAILGGNPGHLVAVMEDNGAEKYCMKVKTRVRGPFSHIIDTIRS